MCFFKVRNPQSRWIFVTSLPARWYGCFFWETLLSDKPWSSLFLWRSWSAIQHEDSSVEELYIKLCMIWRQLDFKVSPDSSEKSSLYKEQESIFKFVMHLHPEFEITRSQILNCEILCTLEEVVEAFVAKETRQPSLVISSTLPSYSILAACYSSFGSPQLSAPPSSFQKKKICNYC